MKLNLSDSWQKALAIMEKQVSNPSYETWIKPIHPIDFSGQTVILQVPNDFAKDWLESRYYDLIKTSLEGVTDQEICPTFVAVSEADETVNGNKTPVAGKSSIEWMPAKLNSKYTFNSFVVGESNKLAYTAALAVAQSPALAYNPLFIYGGKGLGKTHLMQGIGNFVTEIKPEARVSYLSSEKFTDELIKSIRDDNTVEFRNKYRSLDILLVDDIQSIAGKERTQEEFLNTFNALYEANKQIIIGSDSPPKNLPSLEKGLISRFKGGLVAEIQPPDNKTRVSILRKKVDLENLHVPDEVLIYIADQIQSDIRELNGALAKALLYSSLKQTEISIETVTEALQDLVS
ncbi:MAG: chromosomal replication initiator protein DnaA [Thermincola sp.]|nr:chromosomal replication initiator protein DnaA [Thermincola sp.]